MTNLYFMMREGHVDDYFGAWCGEPESLDNFDPDNQKNIIFDIEAVSSKIKRLKYLGRHSLNNKPSTRNEKKGYPI